jgi:hypothetical protein
MGGRPDRMKLNCENPVQQSIGGKRGMKAKLDANQIEALWDEVQANRRLGWKAPTAK